MIEKLIDVILWVGLFVHKIQPVKLMYFYNPHFTLVEGFVCPCGVSFCKTQSKVVLGEGSDRERFRRLMEGPSRCLRESLKTVRAGNPPGARPVRAGRWQAFVDRGQQSEEIPWRNLSCREGHQSPFQQQMWNMTCLVGAGAGGWAVPTRYSWAYLSVLP